MAFKPTVVPAAPAQAARHLDAAAATARKNEKVVRLTPEAVKHDSSRFGKRFHKRGWCSL